MYFRKLQKSFLLFLVIFIAWVIPSFSRGEGDVNVSIRIEGSNSTIFDGNVSVSNCTVTDSSGNTHEFSSTAICALDKAAKQGNFSYALKDYGFGLFLEKIASDETPSDFSKSWSFWVNYDSSSVGADTYQLKKDDQLLFAFSAYPAIPLKVTAPENAVLGTPLTFIAEKRTGTLDEQYVWHGTWENAAGATFYLGSKTISVPEDGKVTLTFSEPISENYWAENEGFVKSEIGKLIISAETSPSPTASPTTSPTATPSPSPSFSPSPTASPFVSTLKISDETLNNSANKGLAFLRSKQDSSGSIDGYATTAWAIMAFGANNDRASTITNGYSLLDALKKSEVESATDIERMILAIRASGNNPKSFNGKNYIKLLLMKYEDNQFGDKNLINDDIFGVLAMLSADENVDRSEIKNTVSTIISKQKDDGAFENLDLTAAAIQALKAYQSKEGSIPVDDSLSKAKAYLREHQDSFGGFGENSASTSWAIQALLSLGENPNDWQVGDSNPWTALLRFQNSDGGFSWKSPGSSSPFMTTYAVPALLKTFWPINKLEMETTPIEMSSPTPTAETQSTAAPSPTVSSPTIAGITTSKTSPKSKPINSPTESPESNISESETILEPRQIPNSENNQSSNTVIALFTVSNVGIGVLVQRILAKLFV